ncbi:MAG: hypothetical protein JWO36_4126 [Myxococcales bacterium]|nr:hypothetical protein [Myxococcales bacterium]
MSRRAITSFIFILGIPSPALAGSANVDVVAGPPIEAAPATDVDPDVAARLDAAERTASANAPIPDLERALDQVLVLYESPDPFSTAQRTNARARSIAILGQLGAHARAGGSLELAARAFDARWSIAGQPHDPELASVLTTWAERDAKTAPPNALYLARRARRSDPQNGRAAALDDDLSRNHRVWPGRAAIVVGLVALAVGIYAESRVSSIGNELGARPHMRDEIDQMLSERHAYDVIGTTLLSASPVLMVGGYLFILSGTPSYRPTSPAELPALGER